MPATSVCRLLSLAAFGWAMLAPLYAVDAAGPPNIVVIVADDLGYGDVGCYAPDSCRIETPCMDALASQGMRFTDAHAATAACSPSRYAILTGRYPWRTRLQQGIVELWEPPLISSARLTIGSVAQKHGYHTVCVGKWHLGWEWPIPPSQRNLFRNMGGSAPGAGGRDDIVTTPSREQIAAWEEVFSRPIGGGPTSRGFDTYFGTDVPNWPPFCFIDNDRTQGIPSTVLPHDQVTKLLATSQGPALPGWKLDAVLPSLAGRACEEISRRGLDRTPFMMYLALTSPHTPIAVAEEWQGRSSLRHPYADFVMQTDAVVGQVLAAIDAAGVASETVVILTSDNGCETKIGVQDLQTKGHFPSGPFRGYKRDAWEGGHRVPFIVRWPGVVTPGSTCKRTICSTDIMATVAEILEERLPPDAGEDSVSLMPLLRGEDVDIHEAVVHQSYQGVFAIRSGRWKLILGPPSGQPNGSRPHLYDLAGDPGETTNLAAENEPQVERLTGLLKRLVADGRSTPGPPQNNDVGVRIFKGNKARAAADRANPSTR